MQYPIDCPTAIAKTLVQAHISPMRTSEPETPEILKSLLETPAAAKAIPKSASELLASRDEDEAWDLTAAAASRDLAFHSKLLRLANSPYYGMSQGVSNANKAISVVGLANAKSLAIACSMLASCPKAELAGLHEAWRLSMSCAGAAHAAAKGCSASPQESFGAASLLMLGDAFMRAQFPGRYSEICAQAPVKFGSSLLRMQFEEFGFNHAQACSALARSWGYPRSLVHILEHAWAANAGGCFDPNCACVSRCLRKALEEANPQAPQEELAGAQEEPAGFVLAAPCSLLGAMWAAALA